jgi:DNA-binding MarR family transcriptional regulator
MLGSSHLFEPTASVRHLTNWAQRLFSRSVDRRVSSMGLSIGQVPVLLILAEEDGLSQKELVRRAVIEQPAMVATLNRMEAAGLLTRRADDKDKRSRTFHLTESARAVVPRLTKVLEESNTRALAGFSEQERGHLVALLRRVIENMTADDGSRVTVARTSTERSASSGKKHKVDAPDDQPLL